MTYLYGFALALVAMTAMPAASQDVVILGEIHDNPHHHALQAERVQELLPSSIVFEMLTPDQADQITPELIADRVALEEVLDWSDSGWPDFAMYYPIFTAADARIYGAAVPREVARQSMSSGLAPAFGPDAGRFGLSDPLPQAEQAARELLQDVAHCDALPDTMLAPMVDIQRLRDASIARETLRALEATDGPVVVITGNGHARKDWGVPALLAQAAPDVSVHVIGQTEDDAPLSGGFDEVLSSPAHPRPDPCLDFQ